MSADFFRVVNSGDGEIAWLLDGLKGRKGKGAFFLCVASSESSDIEGISAAGASPELRRITPSIDAEALVTGRPSGGAALPVSPTGVVSPVVITRACIELAGFGITVVDCGTFKPPELPELKRVGKGSSRCVSTGCAQDYEGVRELFYAGLETGVAISEEVEYIILGECVPAGTTTALGVLTALGISAAGLVSSSLPQSNHDIKSRLIADGLKTAALTQADVQERPLKAVSAVGDPMQPFVAGVALAASVKVPVILGGGSQMLAVYALAQAILKSDMKALEPAERRRISVVTTKWVVDDRTSDVGELSRRIGAPFACACPNFYLSKHEGLRSYEDGNVKEGVAAGASMAVAHIAGGAEPAAIVAAIDRMYDEMVPTRQTAK
ncbi:MAG: TIGR00303 family protein [Candidatus Melainabacteria bacterium]|nr:TIGR00303 family protein [Candidatus Melainabacteria bacterium]